MRVAISSSDHYAAQMAEAGRLLSNKPVTADLLCQASEIYRALPPTLDKAAPEFPNQILEICSGLVDCAEGLIALPSESHYPFYGYNALIRSIDIFVNARIGKSPAKTRLKQRIAGSFKTLLQEFVHPADKYFRKECATWIVLLLHREPESPTYVEAANFLASLKDAPASTEEVKQPAVDPFRHRRHARTARV